MIIFYPRDIGLWREDFDFSDRQHDPSRTFKSIKELTGFVNNKTNDESFPVKFIEEKNNHFGTDYIVHKWTVLGWLKEVNQ